MVDKANYYCSLCGKIEYFNLDPFDLKLALNPDLAIKETWDDEDWNRSIGICKCGGEILPGHPKSKQNIMIGNRPYFKPLHSDSLAINPCQAEEHRRLFPDIGLDSECRPIFENYKQHDDYLKQTGFVKQKQHIKRKGKDITPKKATSKA